MKTISKIFPILIILIITFSCTKKEVVRQKTALTPKQKRISIIKKSMDKLKKSKDGINDTLAIKIYQTFSKNRKEIDGLNFLANYYNNRSENDSILILLATRNYRLKRLDVALNYYKELKYRTPKNKNKFDKKIFSIISQKEKSERFYKEGLKLFNSKNYKKALTKFKRSVQLYKDFNRARYRQKVTQGLIYLSQKDQSLLKVAINNFDSAIKINPDFGETYYYNALAYLQKKRGNNNNKIKKYFELSLQNSLDSAMKIKIAEKYESFKKTLEDK